MNDLPAGWLRAKVGEIADSVQSGFANGDHNRDGIGLPHLRPMNIGRDGHLILEDLRFVKDVDGHRLKRGDVLFNNTNSAELVGKTTWIDIDRELAFSNHMTRVRVPEGVSPEFVGRQLHYLWSRGAFELLCNNHVSQASVSASTLSDEVELVLPPAAEQKRIVVKVEALTARSRRAKEALDAVPPLLDQLCRSILAAAFRGDLTADWRVKNPNVEPADKLIARIHADRRSRWEAAELARMTAKGRGPANEKWHERYDEARSPEFLNGDIQVPATWSIVSVDAIAECMDARRVPVKRETRSEGAFPYYGANGQVGTIGDFIFDEDLVLVTEDETFYGRTKPIAYSVSGKCWVNNHAHVLRPIPPLDPDFLCQLLMYYPVWPWLSGTTGRAKLTQGSLAVLPVPLPPLAEITEITRRVKALYGGIQRLSAQLETRSELLDVLDKSIFAKAFHGELVPQDPNDEPASVLLERIRANRDSERGEASGAPRRSRKAERVIEALGEDDHESEVSSGRPDSIGVASKELSEIDPAFLQDEVSAALWTFGPLEKDEAVRQVADHLRQAGHVDFQRLRADGALFGQVLDAIESAVKAGRLDRPKRGHVRACKTDATTYTPDDWRHALVTSLGTDPVDRDDAIRAAAEWARDNLGLAFTRLREDGHIVEGLRSALNGAIRRGHVIRHDAKLISRKT